MFIKWTPHWHGLLNLLEFSSLRSLKTLTSWCLFYKSYLRHESLKQAQTLKQFAVSCQVKSQWEESRKSYHKTLNRQYWPFKVPENGIKICHSVYGDHPMRHGRKIKLRHKWSENEKPYLWLRLIPKVQYTVYFHHSNDYIFSLLNIFQGLLF